MRVTAFLSTLIVPLAIVATPLNAENGVEVVTRRASPTKPPPCVRRENVSVLETEFRSMAFAKAFIYKKDITAAFRFIVEDYINHNPAAQNGSDSAWGILSPIWASQNITPIRTTFQNPQSWLNYDTGSFGTIVDRFRWEGGCIVEHWDVGEVYPIATSAKVLEVVSEYHTKHKQNKAVHMLQ